MGGTDPPGLERGEVSGESRKRTIRALAEALEVDPAELVKAD
jgi:hypothetical protein